MRSSTLALSIALVLAGLAVSGCRDGHPGNPSDWHHRHHRDHDGRDHYR